MYNFLRKFLLFAVLFIPYIKGNETQWHKAEQNAVVLITSFEIITDIFEPYKTPQQYTNYGSGFFFNKQGDILTNAHVIQDAREIEVTMPTLFGKTIFKAHVKSIAPDTDIAILQLEDDALDFIQEKLEKIPYLPFADSDLVDHADQVLVLGYSQALLKSTFGIISGRQHGWLQTDAAINPGNSGGPLLNSTGEVIGINKGHVPNAQSVFYAIPSNNVTCILKDMSTHRIVYDPFFFIKFASGNTFLADYLNNPHPGGLYVADVCEMSSAYEAGLRTGDMIYEIDSYSVDIYGNMNIPWSKDKVHIRDYVKRLAHGQPLHAVIYRNGERKDLTLTINRTNDEDGVKKVLPEYQDLDYEIFGGITVMELTHNHISSLRKQGNAPGLSRSTDPDKVNRSALIITKIFSTSLAHQLRATGIATGDIIQSVNGIPVSTLDEYRNAIQQNIDQKFLRFVILDMGSIHPRTVPLVLPMKEIIQDEIRVSKLHKYPLTDFTSSLTSYYENKTTT